MAGNDLLDVFVVVAVFVVFVEIVDKKIIADARTYKCFFDSGEFVNFAVELSHLFVRSIEVVTNNGMYTTRRYTFSTDGFIFAFHAVHVG